MSFNWHIYLSETGAEVSPPNLFSHVCRSFQPVVHQGDILEAACDGLSKEPNSALPAFWPAEVVLVSGKMVLFQWCRQDSKQEVAVHPSGKFWFDAKGDNWHLVRPISSTQLKEDVKDLCDNSDAKPVSNGHVASSESPNRRAISALFFKHRILYMHETIRVGGYVECEHENNPCFVWPVKVLCNIGGRLRLVWFGSDGKSSVDFRSQDNKFTLFYLHRRIHPLGWGKYYGLSYCPPPGLVPNRTISNVDAFIRGTPSAFLYTGDDDVLDVRKMRVGHPLYQADPPLHEFKVGWKVEAVNPERPYSIQPATVAQVFNSRYFLIELDDLTPNASTVLPDGSSAHSSTGPGRIQFVSCAGSSEIMPVNTSQLRGLHLTPPPGWPVKRSFTWTSYLTLLSGQTEACSFSVENGLHRCASTNNILPDHPHLPSKGGPDLIHCPSTSNLLSAHSNSSHFLYCPSESVFKGVQISELFPQSLDPDNTLQPKNSSSYLSVDASSDATDVHNRDVSDACRERNPSRFLLGMKLEMVLPTFLADCAYNIQSDSIGLPLCTATVTRVEDPHLLWLLPDVQLTGVNKVLYPIMVDARSMDLFPVGWAASVGHPLIPPPGYGLSRTTSETKVAGTDDIQARESPVALWSVDLRPTHDLQYDSVTYESEEICPPVYINTKCYLGPFLCRTNLDSIPQRFGPGPTSRVMHNLLTRLISAAYKPIRVLRMFEADWASGICSALSNFRTAQRSQSESNVTTRGRYNLQTVKTNLKNAETDTFEQRRVGMRVVLLRIRCPRRGIKIEAPVEICCRARAVEEFCRQVSLVLEACPHLVSLSSPESNHVPLAIEPIVSSISQQNCSSLGSSDSIDLSSTSFSSVVQCPSFCASRLRSRNLDRLPAWKRKMYASLRPFSFHLSTSNVSERSTVRGSHNPSQSSLRTRSAVAAAQRQPQSLGRALSPSQTFPGLTNGVSISRGPRRQRGRIAGRFRGSYLRHLPGQLAQDANPRSHFTGSLKRPYQAMVAAARTPIYDHCTDNSVSLQHEITNLTNFMGDNNPTVCAQKYYSRLHNHVQNYLWRNQRIPIDPYTYTSPSIRPVPRPFPAQDRYPHDVNLSNILSEAPRVTLSSNPLFWTPVELGSYLGETDCKEMWPLLAAEAVDGQAFMLLTLPVLHHLVGLRWEDAIRLARHVVSVKRAFMEQFSTDSADNVITLS